MSAVASASRDLRRIRCARNKQTSALLLKLIKAGHRYKMTQSNGIIIYGPDGSASTHLAGSDHRATENFRADLRRVGIEA